MEGPARTIRIIFVGSDALQLRDWLQYASDRELPPLPERRRHFEDHTLRLMEERCLSVTIGLRSWWFSSRDPRLAGEMRSEPLARDGLRDLVTGDPSVCDVVVVTVSAVDTKNDWSELHEQLAILDVLELDQWVVAVTDMHEVDYSETAWEHAYQHALEQVPQLARAAGRVPVSVLNGVQLAGRTCEPEVVPWWTGEPAAFWRSGAEAAESAAATWMEEWERWGKRWGMARGPAEMVRRRVLESADDCSWRRRRRREARHCRTLMELLEAVPLPVQMEEERGEPLRLAVTGLYRIKGTGMVLTGLVERGWMRAGMQLRCEPLGTRFEVRRIEVHHKTVDRVGPGQHVGILLNIAKGAAVPVGQVALPAHEPPLWRAPDGRYTARGHWMTLSRHPQLACRLRIGHFTCDATVHYASEREREAQIVVEEPIPLDLAVRQLCTVVLSVDKGPVLFVGRIYRK